MIDDAVGQLNHQRSSLLSEAHQCDEEHSRQQMFSIINTCIAIAGAALAPFTGGASLVVAGIATTLSKIAQIATDKSAWSSTDARIRSIGSIADSAVTATSQTRD